MSEELIKSEIVEDRPLSEKEIELVRWLLLNGKKGAENYLSQVDKLWVISRCPCGCASINFSVEGIVPGYKDGMKILSDYCWGTGEDLCGIFVFACEEKLAGLEVWSIDGQVTASLLPDTNKLEQFLVAK